MAGTSKAKATTVVGLSGEFWRRRKRRVKSTAISAKPKTHLGKRGERFVIGAKAACRGPYAFVGILG